MSFVHGKNTKVKLDDTDISKFCNSTERSREADTHDTTTYGKNSKTYHGGLKDGTVTLEGIYDSDEEDGPRAVIDSLLGTKVTFKFSPEGDDGPTDKMDVVVDSYEETSEVADMIQWTAELQMSDDVEDDSEGDD